MEHRRAIRRCLDRSADPPGPLYWLQNHTKTFDEHWQKKGTQPYARFPDKPYMPRLFNLFLTSERLFIPKSREMMLTWAVVGYGVWKCQFFPRTRVIIQAQKEEKVIDLVSGRGNPGYARTLYEQQEAFLKDRCPLVKPSQDMAGDMLAWANGSTLHGVARGGDQVRQYHPTIVVFDEAAHLDDFAEAYGASHLVAGQIIAVSSAAPNWFGEICEEAFDR
ncbi:MAG TPA: hypothetical protein VG204_02700 [Terriglobia bacterium]|nr:hypothetical protein [Terriglobia bacterium]